MRKINEIDMILIKSLTIGLGASVIALLTIILFLNSCVVENVPSPNNNGPQTKEVLENKEPEICRPTEIREEIRELRKNRAGRLNYVMEHATNQIDHFPDIKYVRTMEQLNEREKKLNEITAKMVEHVEFWANYFDKRIEALQEELKGYEDN